MGHDPRDILDDGSTHLLEVGYLPMVSPCGHVQSPALPVLHIPTYNAHATVVAL